MNQQELTKLLVDSYKQAPPFVQRFISSGALSKFVEQTRDKYNLHIDVAGRLSDEITMLMVGISDPKEFIQNLTNEAIVPEASLNLIVADINQQIFVPLREEMRRGPAPLPQQRPQSAAPAPPRPVNAQVPRYAPPTSPMASKGTAPQSTSNFNLQNKIPPPIQRSDLRNVLASVTSEKLLEDHEEPHIEFHAPQPQPQAPRTIPPPANLPGTLPPPPTPPAPVRPPYSTDPYREQI